MIAAEKLTRQISTAMAQNLERAALERLAADYVAACRAVNRRLAQCETMLDANNEYEAIQLAEAEPSLLDQVAALGFDKSIEWRGVCSSKGLPVADALNERAVNRLNNVYQKGIPASHPLYADYRRAIVERDEPRALAVLRTILKLNHDDANAKSEVKRLEAKVLASQLTELGESVQARDIPTVLERLEQLEKRFDLRSRNDAVLTQAREMRREVEQARALEQCKSLADTIKNLKEGGNWMVALDYIRDLDSVCASHSITLEQELSAPVEEARQWARELKRQNDEEMLYQEKLREFASLVQREDIAGAAGGRSTSESLKSRHQMLSGKRRELELFGKAIPEEVDAAFKRQQLRIQNEIARRAKQKRLAIFSSAILFLALAITAAALLLRHQKINDRVAELADLQQHRKVAAAEKFITRLAETEPSLAESRKLQQQIEESKRWIADERNKVATLEGMIRDLREFAGTGFTSRPAESFEPALSQAKEYLKTVASEFRTTLEADLMEVENKFEQYVSSEQEKFNAELKRLLETGESVLTELAERNPSLQEARLKVNALTSTVARLTTLEKPPLSRITVAEALKGRIGALRQKLVPFAQDVEGVEKAEAALRSARWVEDHFAALKNLDAAVMRHLPQIKAARQIYGRKGEALEFARYLLMPDDSASWAYYKANPKHPLKPTVIMPAERTKFLVLRDDDNLNNIYRYEFPPTSASGEHPNCDPPVRSRHCFTRGEVELIEEMSGSDTKIVKLGASLYAPTPDTDRARFVTAVYKCLFPIAAKKPSEYGKVTAESLWHQRLGWNEFANLGAGEFRMTALEFLDKVVADKEGNPIIKAYLQLQLTDLIAVRPRDWGVHWTPSLLAHQKKLLELVADDKGSAATPPVLRSGDWMTPRKIEFLQPKFAKFYKDIEGFSYFKQARFFQKLTQDLDASIAYAGYAGLDGTPHLTPEASGAVEVWGFSMANLTPELLYKKDSSKPDLQRVAQAAPLTPLFYCNQVKTDLLKSAAWEAGLKGDEPWIQPLLPPMFR